MEEFNTPLDAVEFAKENASGCFVALIALAGSISISQKQSTGAWNWSHGPYVVLHFVNTRREEEKVKT